MDANDLQSDDDRFAALLASFDETLRTGSTHGGAGVAEDALGDELRLRLRRAQACLRLIESARRHQPPGGREAASATVESAGDNEEQTPVQLGRFQIVRELGRGGSGVVFLAFDPELHREVALKVPRPEVLITAELRERFLQEARSAACLSHVNVVPVFEAGSVGPICYIASAYIAGPTLTQWLAEHEMVQPVEAARLIALLSDAAEYAHSRGIVHRDLKPSNVILEFQRDTGQSAAATTTTAESLSLDDYQPKIADFGLAKSHDGIAGATHTGAILGTPAYMAPEQAAGCTRRVGPAADIYSLGAILYERLTGRPPFGSQTDLATLQAVQVQDALPPRRVRPHVPRDLEAICLKCLEKEPRQRYAAAHELAEDLRRFLADEPVKARRIGQFQRLSRWGRRNPLLAVLSTSAALLLVAVLSFPWWVTFGNERQC